MRLSSVMNENEFSRLRELAPLMAPAVPGAVPGAAPVPGAVQATQDPAAAAKMQAQQALDRNNQKKQIQDQITATQKQLQNLQKQLAAIR